MATFAAWSGTAVPRDRKLDTFDLSPVLRGTGPSPRQEMFFWTNAELHAVRSGPWKLHIKQREPINYSKPVIPPEPELYHLEVDISEKFDVAEQHPEIVSRLMQKLKDHEADIEPHVDMLAIPLP